MRFSDFGRRFSAKTGTRQLMDDLGEVSQSARGVLNLGGGNPSIIPAVQDVFRDRFGRLLEHGQLDALTSQYDGPQGNHDFLAAIAAALRQRYGWPLTHEHIVTTAGSQASFFMLFNLFGGRCEGAPTRRIMLPLAPEYIGYSDITVEPDVVVSNRPTIEYVDEHTFKYHIDFGTLEVSRDTGALCVTRPTNPTGNVLTQEEMQGLMEMTRTAAVPLIVDNAYGAPFPNIIFTTARPLWDDHVILCMSLSKLGLPGLRTGIVVAHPDVVQALVGMNALMMLANSGLGAGVTTDLIRSGEIIELSEQHIQPYYAARSRQAIAWCHQYFKGLEYFVHKSEGAIFLWLWFPGLPIPAQALYERLKARGVLVLPGHYFFPGLPGVWEHKHECLRISYARDPAQVERGIKRIAEEVRAAY